MTVYYGSRYTYAKTYRDVTDEGLAVTIFDRRTGYIPPHPADTIHVVSEGDRLDLIAFKYYGDTQLGWVILDANPQYDTELDIKPGDRLRIPSPFRIRR